MIRKIMSIYDSKAEAYLQPWFARSTGEALRSFSDEVNSGAKENSLSHHPEDYILFELGTWDEMMGHIVVYEKPKAINSGIDVKRSLQAV